MIQTFDHVSVAITSVYESLSFFTQLLGVRVLRRKADGYDDQFNYVELLMLGVKHELIEPVGDGSFLHRFLRATGEPLHHLSFKVDDIERTVARLQSSVISMVGRTDDDPEWGIAFTHPKSAHGVLLQLLQLKEGGTVSPRQ